MGNCLKSYINILKDFQNKKLVCPKCKKYKLKYLALKKKLYQNINQE